MVSKVQGHKNPFHPDLLRLNIAQLDFILEMQALDDPEHYSFTRGKPTAVTTALAAWHNIFEGGALQRFLSTRINLSVLKRKKAEKPPAPNLRGKGLKDGFSLDADGTGQGSKPEGS